jgi:D-ribose pyranose/furanose isomerase RbsD
MHGVWMLYHDNNNSLMTDAGMPISHDPEELQAVVYEAHRDVVDVLALLDRVVRVPALPTDLALDIRAWAERVTTRARLAPAQDATELEERMTRITRHNERLRAALKELQAMVLEGTPPANIISAALADREVDRSAAKQKPQ